MLVSCNKGSRANPEGIEFHSYNISFFLLWTKISQGLLVCYFCFFLTEYKLYNITFSMGISLFISSWTLHNVIVYSTGMFLILILRSSVLFHYLISMCMLAWCVESTSKVRKHRWWHHYLERITGKFSRIPLMFLVKPINYILSWYPQMVFSSIKNVINHCH